MKKYHLLPAAAILLLSGTVTLHAADDGGGDKVEVVHNGKVIKVAPAAVAAHLNHGDQLACPTYPDCDNGGGGDYDEEEEAQ